MKRMIHGIEVSGVDVDESTRCRHWFDVVDIIAIKFKCCGEWFPCYECHSAEADHPASVWPAGERDAKAVLCGACGHQPSITEYLNCDSACPGCGSKFNPGCAKHFHLYFA